VVEGPSTPASPGCSVAAPIGVHTVGSPLMSTLLSNLINNDASVMLLSHLVRRSPIRSRVAHLAMSSTLSAASRCSGPSPNIVVEGARKQTSGWLRRLPAGQATGDDGHSGVRHLVGILTRDEAVPGRRGRSPDDRRSRRRAAKEGRAAAEEASRVEGAFTDRARPLTCHESLGRGLIGRRFCEVYAGRVPANSFLLHLPKHRARLSCASTCTAARWCRRPGAIRPLHARDGDHWRARARRRCSATTSCRRVSQGIGLFDRVGGGAARAA
jgi:hypothetical protein